MIRKYLAIVILMFAYSISFAEMKEGKVDWQMVYYGNAVHSFTKPSAGNDPSTGAAYNEKAAKRSWKAMKIFLQEVFE